jgi:hypothetical protein
MLAPHGSTRPLERLLRLLQPFLVAGGASQACSGQVVGSLARRPAAFRISSDEGICSGQLGESGDAGIVQQSSNLRPNASMMTRSSGGWVVSTKVCLFRQGWVAVIRR